MHSIHWLIGWILWRITLITYSLAQKFPLAPRSLQSKVLNPGTFHHWSQPFQPVCIASLHDYLCFSWIELWVSPWCFSMGLPWWLSGKESVYNAGDTGLIPGSGRSPGGRNENPLQFLSGKSHGQRSLAGAYSPRSRKRVGHNFVTKQQQ